MINSINVELDKFLIMRNSGLLDKSELFFGSIIITKIDYCYSWIMRENTNYTDDDLVHLKLTDIYDLVGYNNKASNLLDKLESLKLFFRSASYKVGFYNKGFKPLKEPTGEFITLNTADYLNKSQLTRLKKRLAKNRTETEKLMLKYIKRSIDVDVKSLRNYYQVNYNIEMPATKKGIEEFLKRANLTRDFGHLPKEVIKYLPFDRFKTLDALKIKESNISIGEKGGRYYHLMTNMSHELKRCIISKIKNKPYLMQLDIKNSQPFFLLCLIISQKLEIETSLYSAVLNGYFYETIGESWGYIPEQVTNDRAVRKAVKETVYRDIFFCQSNNIRIHSKGFRQIEKKYPLFCKAIINITSRNDNTLASILQRLETLEVVPFALEYKTFNLHDAIIIPTENENDIILDEIISKMQQHFLKKYGICPQLSKELISKREK